MRKEDKSKPNANLCEQLVSFANVQEAIRKVMANKGACGVDNMEVSELPEYFEANWPGIRKRIVSRKYKPQPVLRVEIPKDRGEYGFWGFPRQLTG